MSAVVSTIVKTLSTQHWEAGIEKMLNERSVFQQVGTSNGWKFYLVRNNADSQLLYKVTEYQGRCVSHVLYQTN